MVARVEALESIMGKLRDKMEQDLKLRGLSENTRRTVTPITNFDTRGRPIQQDLPLNSLTSERSRAGDHTPHLLGRLSRKKWPEHARNRIEASSRKRAGDETALCLAPAKQCSAPSYVCQHTISPPPRGTLAGAPRAPPDLPGLVH